ncbi:MAG: hypothetical protein ABIA63_04545, partial [bacterium]
MLKTLIKTLTVAALAVLMTFLYMGCTDVKDDNPTSVNDLIDNSITNVGGEVDSVKNGTKDNPSGTSLFISETQKTQAAVLANTAKGNLETEMKSINMDEIESPTDFQTVNFASINADYKTAIAQNPNNTEAQFGAAVTEMVLLVNSKIANDFDSIMNHPMLEGENEEPVAGKRISLFKMARMNPQPEGLPNTGLALAKIASSAENFPRISEIQDSLITIVLPVINYALNRLQVVENDPDFKFLITPQLFGEDEGDTVELDLGEIYLFDAALKILRASILCLTAYNFDIDDNGSYKWIDEIDSVEDTDDSMAAVLGFRRVKYLFENDPDFLTLRAGGAVNMKEALASLQAAIMKVKASMTFIR